MEVIYRVRRACRMFWLALTSKPGPLDISNLKPGQCARVVMLEDRTLHGKIDTCGTIQCDEWGNIIDVQPLEAK